MAWQKNLIMTDKRIKARESEKRYRDKHRPRQETRTPEQQEQYRQMWRKYNDSNKEKLSNKGKKYYSENRDIRLEYSKQYHKDNPEVNLRNGQKYLERLGVDLGILSSDVKRVLMNWKRTIQKRDNVCQVCGSKDNLNAHHILHRKYYPKLALNVNNGIILCKQHHNESHGWCLN
jgi:hypothetical protein